MPSLSNSTDIHCVDCNNKALNNSIHRNAVLKMKILIKMVVSLAKKLVINKNMEMFLLNQSCNATVIDYTELLKNCKYYYFMNWLPVIQLRSGKEFL